MPTHPSTALAAPPASISVYDARPFFEKALLFGVQNGIIDQQKLDAICDEAPKGMVQIARYFESDGSEFLRPSLERAKDQMLNFVSLYLEKTSGGDLRKAAESLRDHSFLSRSKGGSDMLKDLIAMPESSHFGMTERSGFTDGHKPMLAKCAVSTLAEYQAELVQRSPVALVIDAAIWLADALGMEAAELEDATKDAEAVIRTALLTLATNGTQMPDWVAFEKMLATLRKKYGVAKVAAKTTVKATDNAGASPLVLSIAIPKNLPPQFKAVLAEVRQSVIADLQEIVRIETPVKKMFTFPSALWGRYYWVENSLGEVDQHDRSISKAWDKATKGHSDEGSLLTLFLCVAAGSAPKTLLTEKGAATLIRKIQKTGLTPEFARQYILDNAPAQHQDDYLQLWDAFIEDAQDTLQSDSVYGFKDALALLQRECNVT